MKNLPVIGMGFSARVCPMLLCAAILSATQAVEAAAGNGGVPAMDSPDMTATTLVIIGLVLLMLEIKIVSQGLLGFLASLCLISATVIIWRDGSSFWGIPVLWAIPVIILVLVLGLVLSVLAVKAYKERVVSGFQGFVGEIAEASENLNPEGRVFFQGTYWTAESTAPVEKGAKVRILEAGKLRLRVEPMVAATEVDGAAKG